MPIVSSKKLPLFLLFFCLAFPKIYAQQTATYFDPEKEYKLSLDLFDKQKYAAAEQKLDLYIAHYSTPMRWKHTGGEAISEESYGNAHFYAAICAAELFN